MRFNKADYEAWLLRPIWSLEEGIHLLLGFEPIHNVKGSLRRIQGADEFKQEIITWLDIGDRAIKAGTLKVEGDYHPAHWACELYPTTFLKWAKSNGWEIPDELASILSSPEPVEEKLDPRERTSLLQIIAALAKEAKIDLAKHQAAAATVQTIGATYGIELPNSQNTIANKLREANELLKSQ